MANGHETNLSRCVNKSNVSDLDLLHKKLITTFVSKCGISLNSTEIMRTGERERWPPQPNVSLDRDCESYILEILDWVH